MANPEADLLGLIDVQYDRMHRIGRSVENARKSGQHKTIEGLRGRLEMLEKHWSQFMADHAIIRASRKLEIRGSAYIKDTICDEVEESYLAEKMEFRVLLRELEAEQARIAATTEAERALVPAATTIRPEVALPRIPIPRFNGAFDEWISFRDLFNTLVAENASLAPIHRMHFLKQNVSGEAEQFLRHYMVADDTFEPAWRALCSRYDNKRLLVDRYLEALFSIPAIQKESATELKRVLDRTSEIRTALQLLGQPVESWDAILVFHTRSKLDPVTRRAWQDATASIREPVSWLRLSEFLEEKQTGLQASAPSGSSAAPGLVNPQKSKGAAMLTQKVSKGQCGLCKRTHPLWGCQQFRDLPAAERRERVRTLGLCYNCLAGTHRATTCAALGRCRECGGTHHTLLHVPEEAKPAASEEVAAATTHATHTEHSGRVWMATARVRLETADGRSEVVRALIDPCSEVSLISEAVAQRLRAPRRPLALDLSGAGGLLPRRVRSATRFQLRSLVCPSYSTSVEAYVMPNLTAYAPPRAELSGVERRLRGLRLADSLSATDKVEALLGAPVFLQIIRQGMRRGPSGTFVAQDTHLGWILTAALNVQPTDTSPHCHMLQCVPDDTERALRRFWEQEEVTVVVPSTPADQDCEAQFVETCRRQSDGRYVVRLPMKNPKARLELGESRRVARASLARLERRLENRPPLRDAYHRFLQDYERLGHMTKVMSDRTLEPCEYFVPHHPVVKGTEPELKIRVVFNASQSTSSGRSLNDLLHVGPRLQRDLREILLGWRMARIVFVADIEQMFRQIRMHPDDQALQQIFWREGPNEPVSRFRLTTVTYGTACAPYLAVRVLRRLVEDEGARFPRAAELILRHTYVDDVLAGADDLREARLCQRELTGLLMAGGFRLRKWASNCPELLDEIPEQDQEPLVRLQDIEDVGASVLGVGWLPASDEFHFVTDAPCSVTVTKRGLLSAVARVYDPLGWLAPVLVDAKILLQELWLDGVQWDQELPPRLAARWTSFCSNLSDLADLRVPRWVGWSPRADSVELHGFSDASERAYAAAVFVVSRFQKQDTRVSLLVAKTKVAPVRRVTLPRLELCGAVLLARLLRTTAEAVQLPDAPQHCWTDSRVVMAWLAGHPTRWSTYVANRVATVHELLPKAVWRHVPSRHNPADCASRGISARALRHHLLWWSGPEWLGLNATQWPAISEATLDADLPEQRRLVHAVALPVLDWEGVTRASTYRRAVRVMAFVLRFRRGRQGAGAVLGAGELHEARLVLLRRTQQLFHGDVISTIQRGQPLSISHPLSRLRPVMGPDGLLRVGGRLERAHLPFEQRRPILLPRTSRLTELIVRDAHERALHGGTQLTLTALRRQFWVPAGRALVRGVVRRCVVCARHGARPMSQLMAPLPRERVVPAPPFQVTGVDYAGPVMVRTSKGRGHKAYKGYIAVFVCFTTRAIHLELVSDYSSETFLAALRRFTARRGTPATIFSDQGTTFVGADRELRAQLRQALDSAGPVAEAVALQGIEWRFNPPAAPHFGGLWEAGVRSVKHHLRRVVGEHTLTYEEYATLLARVEAALNSRPLCPISEDPEDLEALTPGHFLVGRPLLAPPEPTLEGIPESRLDRWQLLQRMSEHLWARWSREYLQQLQARSKWTVPERPPREGEMVLILDSRLPPSKWQLGRIKALHPGPDGLVRVALVKTADAELTRPLVKLVRLPVEGAAENGAAEGEARE